MQIEHSKTSEGVEYVSGMTVEVGDRVVISTTSGREYDIRFAGLTDGVWFGRVYARGWDKDGDEVVFLSDRLVGIQTKHIVAVEEF